MVVLAKDSIQFSNGMVCSATHIVGDCLFELGDKSWSFSDMLAKELGFDDIANTVLDNQEYRDTLSQFMLNNYFDYQAYNHI